MAAVIENSYFPHDLPWTLQAEQQARFNKLLRWSVVAIMFFAFLFAFLPLPEPEEIEKPEPERLVKLIPKVEVPPPPPPKVVPVKNKVKPKPKPRAKPKPQPKKEPIKTATKPKKAPVPTKSAKEIAASSGLLAMKDELSDIKNVSSSAALGERSLNKSGTQGKITQRSLVTKNYGKASGGINTANLSTSTGGNGLGGRSAGSIGGSGIGGGSGTGSGGGNGSGNGDGSGYGKTRDLEKIQIMFDRNKSGLFTLYNRELRKDASLQGKVVLNITIAPSGKVTSASIVSSQLGNPALESKILQRVKLINFGAEDVPSFTFNYPIDFYPV
ncbi:MAG: AgmX/PglI C-terminal domain-containing protein [Gammaproteobacteria bacterium]